MELTHTNSTSDFHRLDRLDRLIGVESDLEVVARALKHDARELQPGLVGAMHLTCADESEHECSDAFQDVFVNSMLPSLKYAHKAPFRLANLGGRYEWGAARLVENHFNLRERSEPFTMLVFKVNSHVSKDKQLRYGQMERYRIPSIYCGALGALLGQGLEPALDDLRESFGSEDKDRLAMLHEHVPDELRPLAAAIVNARLQARSATLEMQEIKPANPLMALVVACVTLNTPERDTELVVGYYVIDRRAAGDGRDHYVGIGDDPSRFRITHDDRILHVAEGDGLERKAPKTEEGPEAPMGPPRPKSRLARNHRELIGKAWERQKPPAPRAFEQTRHKVIDSELTKPLLKTLVFALAQTTGAPVGLFLFAEGLVGLHHVWQAHRLAHQKPDPAASEAMIREFEERLDRMPPEQAQVALKQLLKDYNIPTQSG